ncbi:MAG TPA: NAD(P)/FAD-dependent oxidoreductase [Candidatus Bathyarchaeota archaeon]|nr:NAD(P)/FAD-dependent oxidoreductase [Candidatus Bathyarchaeota archaeon]
MNENSDVIVVGGGPCGSFTALNLGKLGAKVTVFEEHSQIGVPCHCAGHLSIKGLKRLGLYPLPKGIVENTFKGAVFHSPKGKNLTVKFANHITCVVNRASFDKYLADKAEKAEAHYFLSSRVESLIIKNNFVKGVKVRHNGKTENFTADIVVDAEGISSKILRQTGLTALNSRMLVNAVQANVENVKDVEPDMVEVFLGKNYAPGFYAWLIPQKDGKAKVGLAAKTGNPKDFLRKLIRKHPTASKKLGKAKLLHAAFHPITLGGPIPKTYSNGFLAVGDVASQAKPTTGGGVIFGLNCARIAAEVAYDALKQKDFSSKFLSNYQKRYNKILDFDVKVMLKLRKMLDALSDNKIDEAISFCGKLGLDKTIQGMEDIDFQGRSLLRSLPKPRMLAALFYFFSLQILKTPRQN